MKGNYSLKHCRYRFQDEKSDKTYDLIMLTDSNRKGDALLVKRWGKAGTSGQAGVLSFANCRLGNIEFTKAEKQRFSKNYEKIGSTKEPDISNKRAMSIINELLPNSKGCAEARERIESFLKLQTSVPSPTVSREETLAPVISRDYEQWGTW